MIIAILIFSTLIFGVFGYTERIQAEVAIEESLNQKMAAEAAQAEAERLRIESEIQQAVAEDTMEKYQTALRDLDLLKK